MKSASYVFVGMYSTYTVGHVWYIRTGPSHVCLVLTSCRHTMTMCHCHHLVPCDSYVKEDQLRKLQKELEEVKES